MKILKVELGPNPAGEDCVGINKDDPNNHVKMVAESNRYVEQLKRQFPDWEAKGVWFKVVTHQHEFGPYVEVEVRCNEDVESAVEYCFDIEANIPEKWDIYNESHELVS